MAKNWEFPKFKRTSNYIPKDGVAYMTQDRLLKVIFGHFRYKTSKQCVNVLAVQLPKQNILKRRRHFVNALFISSSWINDFWILIQNWRDRPIFKRKYIILKVGLIWADFDIYSAQIPKQISSSTSTSEMTHETCVTRHSCNIFIRQPYLTWISPWSSFNIRHIHKACTCSVLFSPHRKYFYNFCLWFSLCNL